MRCIGVVRRIVWCVGVMCCFGALVSWVGVMCWCNLLKCRGVWYVGMVGWCDVLVRCVDVVIMLVRCVGMLVWCVGVVCGCGAFV